MAPAVGGWIAYLAVWKNSFPFFLGLLFFIFYFGKPNNSLNIKTSTLG